MTVQCEGMIAWGFWVLLLHMNRDDDLQWWPWYLWEQYMRTPMTMMFLRTIYEKINDHGVFGPKWMAGPPLCIWTGITMRTMITILVQKRWRGFCFAYEQTVGSDSKAESVLKFRRIIIKAIIIVISSPSSSCPPNIIQAYQCISIITSSSSGVSMQCTVIKTSCRFAKLSAACSASSAKLRQLRLT